MVITADQRLVDPVNERLPRLDVRHIGASGIAQGLMQPEGHGGPCAMGEQGSAPSGVYDYGTLEEDGLDTWETLIAPCGTRARVGRRQGTTGAEADGDEGV